MNRIEATALINQNIRALKAYHLEPEETQIKLNQNENPFDWPLPIKEEIARFCIDRPWNRYPPFIPETLKAAIAEYAGVEAGSVIVGNGSNEMLLVLMLSLVNRDSTVITCVPTFSVYRLLTDGLGAAPAVVPLDAQLNYDVPKICNAVLMNPHATLVLCSPNNPTGTALTEEEIRKILGMHKGFLILDQAYVEFGGYNAVPLLKVYPNLIITRTFSKAFAGAGLRLGYLLGTPEIVREMSKIKLPYNINFFSEHVAQVLLRNRALLADGLATIRKERDRLLADLMAFPFDNVYPSDANFICVRYSEKARLFEAIKKAGILLRDVSSYPLLENCLRISVGSPQENEALIDALNRFFSVSSK
jgi:histidinol-phosphate aminotransferase